MLDLLRANLLDLWPGQWKTVVVIAVVYAILGVLWLRCWIVDRRGRREHDRIVTLRLAEFRKCLPGGVRRKPCRSSGSRPLNERPMGCVTLCSRTAQSAGRGKPWKASSVLLTPAPTR